MVYDMVVSGSVMVISGTTLEVAGGLGYHEHVPQHKVLSVVGLEGTVDKVAAFVHLGRRVTKADYA